MQKSIEKLFFRFKSFFSTYQPLTLSIVTFLFFAGFITTYTEITFIAHSFIFSFVIFILFLLFSAQTIIHKTPINKHTFNPFIIFHILAFLFLIPFSIVKYYTINETYRIVAPVLLYWVIVNTIKRDETQSAMDAEEKIYFYGLFLFGLFVGIVSYMAFDNKSPLASIWGYTNTFAAFLVLMILMGMGIYLDATESRDKIFLSFLPIFFIFLLFLTVSRGGYISLFVALLTLYLIDFRRAKEITKQLIPVFVGAAIIIILDTPKEILLANIGKTTILAKFATGISYDSSLGDRVHMAILALQIFLKRPLTGFGLGSFRFLFTQNAWTAEPLRIDPHSFFFKLLSETGIIGTAAFFSMIGYILFQALKEIKTKNKNFIYKGLFAGTVGMFFHMCIDVDIYPIMFIVLFYALALLTPKEFVSQTTFQKNAFKLISVFVVVLLILSLPIQTFASTYALKSVQLTGIDAITTEGADDANILEHSIELMEKATQIDPQNPSYTFYLGELILRSMNNYNEQDKIKKVIDAYTKTIELNKFDYRPYYRLGIVYLFNKDQRSIIYLKKAEELYPNGANVLAWLSVAYNYLNNDLEKAKFYYKKARENGNNIYINFAGGVCDEYLCVFDVFCDATCASHLQSSLSLGISPSLSFQSSSQSFQTPSNYCKAIYTFQMKVLEDLRKKNKKYPHFLRFKRQETCYKYKTSKQKKMPL